MPLYDYHCPLCGSETSVVQPYTAPNPSCCGYPMAKYPSAPAMVKIKGEGGYPSRRKFVKGSAPGTTRSTKVWGDYDPADKSINYMGTKKEE